MALQGSYARAEEEENIVSLGEGMTPILETKTITGSVRIAQSDVLKDESKNPTGSFKARGLSAAVSKAKEFGVQTCICQQPAMPVAR